MLASRRPGRAGFDASLCRACETPPVTISGDHPFAPPEEERSPLRRFRGRMPQPVTLWCSQLGDVRAGWTVSSLLVAEGDPPEVAGLVDEESDLAALAARAGRVAVSLLGWEHRSLADAFAGLAPAPGGPFRLGSWTGTPWGPVLADAVGWLGVELSGPAGRLGWGLLLRGACRQVGLGPGSEVLGHLRGRYRSLPLS